ncbi:MAG: 5-(carboxyamino)imidazole ribonucleotide mutase [Ketobacteraceae bacterium]|nr:5-(carboxyamino)imidazole ribonucleotide mutase [Ketobacteraceae bacterium]
MSSAPVSIIMGSRSDWPYMKEACIPLEQLEVDFETNVVSAHRTPDRMQSFAKEARDRGVKVIIAGAGGSAHLAGMVAANTPLPVVAVPMPSRHFAGVDSLMSMVQMPRGIAVATQAVGAAGAYNGGLIAAQILALSDPALASRLDKWRQAQTDAVPWEVE